MRYFFVTYQVAGTVGDDGYLFLAKFDIEFGARWSGLLHCFSWHACFASFRHCT